MSELDDWTHRIDDTVRRIGRLMHVDARRFVIDTMREAFVAGQQPLDLDEVRALKATTVGTAERTADELQAAILAVAWREPLVLEETSDPPRITDVKAISDAVKAMTAAAQTLVDRNGFTAEVHYQLPQRFIDHDALPTLTRTLFKAIARYSSLRAEDEARQIAQTVQSRRQLWEEA